LHFKKLKFLYIGGVQSGPGRPSSCQISLW